jgi:hypothetical protein
MGATRAVRRQMGPKAQERSRIGRGANQYHAARIAGAGIQELLQDNNKKRTGVSTFSDNKLSVGQILSVDAIRLQWGCLDNATYPNATSDDAAKVRYGNSMVSLDNAKDIPQVLLNGDLEIHRNDELQVSISISRCIVPGDVTTSGASQAGTVRLEVPKEFKSTDTIRINLRHAENSLAIDGTHSYFVRVQLLGTEQAVANSR